MGGGGGGGICWPTCQDWSNCAYTTYMRKIKHSVLDREKNCDQYGPSFKHNGAGLCVSKCNDGDDDWVILPLCTKKNCDSYGPGWRYVLGVCWQDCTGNQTDMGALCRDKCTSEEDEVLGVCWGRCNQGDKDIGALCRENCVSGVEQEVLGVCWKGCNANDTDVGALCREKCRDGFNEVAGVCWGNKQTYVRPSMIPKSVTTYDPGWNPPNNTNNLDFPVCDFAHPTMMDRMAQFYYDQSTLNAKLLTDGRLTYEYIVMFYGVIASSELSCDVACAMKTVAFNPITGDNYTESYGTTYSNDPGNTVSYRRFYFARIHTDKGTDSVSDPNTPGNTFALFTVTGCTHTDFTAPTAHVKSADEGVDPPISVPKIFEVTMKETGKIGWDMNTFKRSLATTTATMAVNLGANTVAGAGPFGAGGNAVIGGIAGGVAGGMAGEAVARAYDAANSVSVSLGKSVKHQIVGNKEDGLFIATNNDYYSINHGPIYETRAAQKNGYVPKFSFCEKIITTELLCTNEYVLRDTIKRYEILKNKHIKTVVGIEPRGKDGCYYKWTSVSYDTNTNLEGKDTQVEEIVRRYEIKDKSTCVWTPTDDFSQDFNKYTVRSYKDPLTNETIYPTRRTISVPIIKGRYIRIRPSLTANDRIIQLSQVVVYNSVGKNAALNKYVISTSSTGGKGPAKIVDGTLAVLNGVENIFQMNGANEYIEIDLGYVQLINTVYIYGMLDSSDTSRNSGIRVQILEKNGANDTHLAEITTSSTSYLQFVDFTRQELNQFNVPRNPFIVPRALPKETILDSCPTRCQDRPQIDSFIQSFNSSNKNQILKVLRAVTRAKDRCDYEVEMIRNTENGKTTVGRDIVTAQVSLKNKTENTGIAYGRYVRMTPAANASPGFLAVSQIVVISNNNNIALNKPVYATSKQYLANTPDSIVDGYILPRLKGDYWELGNNTQSNQYIEIDLGATYPISSIIYYPGADSPFSNISKTYIQILNDNDIYATPVWQKNLPGISKIQEIPIKLTFPQCSYGFSNYSYDSNFIQENTPYLEAVDTSGGILTFNTIGNKIMNIISSVVKPIIDSNPTKVLDENVNTAETTVINLMNSVGASSILFPDITYAGRDFRGFHVGIKCNDPDVMDMIMKYYNRKNASIVKDNIITTRVMSQISAIGSSRKPKPLSPYGFEGTCDVLFSELYNAYEDIMYDPIITQTNTLAKRFTFRFNGVKNTYYSYLQAKESLLEVTSDIDISNNAFGLTSTSSILDAPYSNTQCEINCRDPNILSSIKNMFDSKESSKKSSYDNSVNTTLQTLTAIQQSFARTPSLCEYMILKDITTKSSITNKSSTKKGISTYVTASFSDACNTTSLTDVMEFDPDTISITTAGTVFVKGVEYTTPYLLSYNSAKPSNKVNELVQKIS